MSESSPPTIFPALPLEKRWTLIGPSLFVHCYYSLGAQHADFVNPVCTGTRKTEISLLPEWTALMLVHEGVITAIRDHQKDPANFTEEGANIP